TGVGVLAVIAVLTCVYAVLSAAPVIWERIRQPDAAEEFDFREIYPVREIAFRRDNPSIVLYRARNADHVDLKFSIEPNETPTEFDKNVEKRIEGEAGPVEVASVTFRIKPDGEPAIERCSGAMRIFAIADRDKRLHYIRSLAAKKGSNVEN